MKGRLVKRDYRSGIDGERSDGKVDKDLRNWCMCTRVKHA